jgi:tetratricopeptide (TPR) repeat protein
VWIGNTHRSWEEWPAALEAYDAALALSANHPDALIGRTVALSQLGRAQDAIQSATRVIDNGQWMVGEAYYWRAWVNCGSAICRWRANADRARTQMANARVYVLSGVIEWRMRRLESAERDFQQAVTIDLGECEGAFDLGIVRDELRRFPESLAAFKQAGQCNDLSLKLRQEAIARIESVPVRPPRARAVARHKRAQLEKAAPRITRAIAALEQALSDQTARRAHWRLAFQFSVGRSTCSMTTTSIFVVARRQFERELFFQGSEQQGALS